MNRQKLIFIALFAILQSNLFGQSQQFEDCSIVLKDDTLTIGNSLIFQNYLWNNGNLISLHLTRKDMNVSFEYQNYTTPEFIVSSQFTTPKNGKITIYQDSFSPLDKKSLKTEITFNLEDLEVKRIIEIFPGIAAISNTFYLKGEVPGNITNENKTNDRGMIESEEIIQNLGQRIGRISFENPHWNFTVADFTEATDHHNTLVKTFEISAYNKEQRVKGNVILGKNILENSGFFILKESPLGENQKAYPGADFEISQTEVNILGLGIPSNLINKNDWVRGYGYSIGINNANSTNLLMDLKLYQKQRRTLRADRDEMILANTWGDRSRDSRMNEAFILREIESCAKLGVTHLQLDDGWQQGLSKNSASKSGLQWDDWSDDDWKPNKDRFPNGLNKIASEAAKHGIEICLWFNPSKKDNYYNWERDANILIDYYNNFGIRVFKIDGIELSNKTDEINVRRFFNKIKEATTGKVVFNMDVTAGQRMGYFYFLEYGNLFLENRYTDWGNYYPHRTLRNIWMLSEYIPSEKLQVEFLNKWRNADKYQATDPIAPSNIPFDFIVATTFAGQPLTWMEVSNLPEEAFKIKGLLSDYKKIQYDFHKGVIMPVGEEPNGVNWSGFQSVNSDEGYFIIYRAFNSDNQKRIKTYLPSGKKVKLEHLFGHGTSFESEINEDGELLFELPKYHTFAMYKYSIL